MTEPGLLDGLECSESLRDRLRHALAYDVEARTTTLAELAAALREHVNAGAPRWAAQVHDDHGAWASVAIDELVWRMRWIPPGSFVMGSPPDELGRSLDEGPQHEVTLSEGFWLAETPCTRALWTRVMGSSAGEQANSTHPVSEVAWNDVQAFLTKLADRVPGASFGLPSEAQWEYACRAGTRNTRYGEVDEIAWTSRNASGSTHPVAQLQPNAWGLYDMLGNVWEWCADAWTRYGTAPCVDPRTTEGGERVRRGGSWGSDARFARAACRMAHAANDRYGNVGFRMIRRGDPPQAK